MLGKSWSDRLIKFDCDNIEDSFSIPNSFLTEYSKSFFLFSIPSIVASFLALFSLREDNFS